MLLFCEIPLHFPFSDVNGMFQANLPVPFLALDVQDFLIAHGAENCLQQVHHCILLLLTERAKPKARTQSKATATAKAEED